MPLLANARLGPYEIRSTLGAGGMGEVYRARDTRLNRDVAIKVLREDDAASVESRSRFEREARAIAALNHPNIVAVYDFGVEAGQQYIVSELVEGESLRPAHGQACSHPQTAGYRNTGSGRSGCRARRRSGPPRPEAGKHHAGQGWQGQGSGLRPCAAGQGGWTGWR